MKQKQNTLLKKALSPGESSAQVVNYLIKDQPFVTVRTPMNPQLAAKIVKMLDRWNTANRVMDSVEQMRDYVVGTFSPPVRERYLSVFKVQVQNEFGISSENEFNHGKPFHVVSARQVYHFVGHKIFGFPCMRKDIFLRDHATVLYSCKKFIMDMNTQQVNQQQYVNLLNFLHGDLLNSPLGLGVTGEEIFEEICDSKI